MRKRLYAFSISQVISSISHIMKQMEVFTSILIGKKRLRFVFLIFLVFWLILVIYCRYSSSFSHDGISFSNEKSSTDSTNFMYEGNEEPLVVDSCSGQYIYVQDIPSRFNTEILENCSTLLKWPKTNMCEAILNMGIGPLIENTSSVLGSNSWFITHPNLLEVIFHNRMKQYKCLTNDSSLATLVYIPFYAGLDLGRYLWDFNNSVRDSGPIALLQWLTKKPEWGKFLGGDHFFVVGRTTWDFRRFNSDWGNNLMHQPQVGNITILSIESTPWLYRDFSIPYPTHFHPSNDNQVLEWQKKMRGKVRPYLFSFVGGPRPDQRESIRGELIDQCLSSKGSCKWLKCGSVVNCDDPVHVMKVLESSRFCLQPRGDTATRRSTFDSILAGCIPVFFSIDTAYTQYLWHLPKNYTEYSVYIPEDAIRNGTSNIERILLMISEKDVFAMRENILRLIPNIMYANPNSRLDTIEDAFDIAIKGVIERVTTIRKKNKNSVSMC